MAKFVKNENESPEVDLKNLTVRLSGLGMDKEIEDVIPGKKSKDYKVASEEESPDEDEENEKPDEDSDEFSSDNEENTAEEADDNDDLIESGTEDTEEFDETASEEVESFFEKRAAERNLTLEKVEELANEMSSDDPSKERKVTKIKSEEKTEQPKKKAKFDMVTVAGILLALAALGAGIYYIMSSMNHVVSLGLTESEYRQKYLNSPYYTQTLSKFGFALPSPTYRDENASNLSEGQYYDEKIDNRLISDLYLTGIEIKGGKLLKQLRIYAIVNTEEQVDAMLQIYGSYLIPLDDDLESSKAYEKINNAYLLSLSSTERAVIVKDNGYAFSVSLNTINGYDMIVLDIIPKSEADKYVFQDVI